MKKKSSKLKQHFQKLTPSEVCTPCHAVKFLWSGLSKISNSRILHTISFRITHLGSTLNKWELKGACHWMCTSICWFRSKSDRIMQNVNHDIQTSEHYNFFHFWSFRFFLVLELPTTRELSFALVFEFVQPCWGSHMWVWTTPTIWSRHFFIHCCVNVVTYVHTHVATAQTSCVTSKVCANNSSRVVDTPRYKSFCVTPKITINVVFWSLWKFA